MQDKNKHVPVCVFVSVFVPHGWVPQWTYAGDILQGFSPDGHGQVQNNNVALGNPFCVLNVHDWNLAASKEIATAGRPTFLFYGLAESSKGGPSTRGVTTCRSGITKD